MRQKQRAFTLVELLVVVGIISLLIGILLPTLSRARQSSNRIACLSNLRQLAVGLILYCQDNQGWLPRAAPSATLGQPESPQDFLWWQEATEAPVMAPNRDLYRSPILKYLGIKPDSPQKPTPVDLAESRAKVLRCPSDDLADRLTVTNNGKYFFSYSLNNLMQSVDPSIAADVTVIPINTVTGQPFQVAGKLCRVHDPDSKILFVEESEATLSDGSFDPTEQSTGAINGILSVRHDSSAQLPDTVLSFTKVGSTWTIRNGNCRGNVAFCDGHADSVYRTYVNDPTSKLTGDFVACDPLR